MNDIHIIMLDGGLSPMILDLSNYSSLVNSNIKRCMSVEEALYKSIQMLPSFTVALFAVNGEYFIAKGQSVNLSKYRKGSGKSTINRCTIIEIHLKPVRNQAVKHVISSYIARYTESVTERLKLTDDRHNLLISCLEFFNIADVFEVADKTVHY